MQLHLLRDLFCKEQLDNNKAKKHLSKMTSRLRQSSRRSIYRQITKQQHCRVIYAPTEKEEEGQEEPSFHLLTFSRTKESTEPEEGMVTSVSLQDVELSLLLQKNYCTGSNTITEELVNKEAGENTTLRFLRFLLGTCF